MNRLASKPQPKNKPPRIVATLDLSDGVQHQLHAFFQRMHTGRWPQLRSLAVRQMPDGTIVEAVEWLRHRSDRFAVLEWSARDGAVTWRCRTMKTHSATLAALRSL